MFSCVSQESESGSGSESESEDSLFSRGSETESSSDDEVINQLPGREKWLKRVVDTSKQQARDAKRQSKQATALKSKAVAEKEAAEKDVLRRAAAAKRVEETMTEDVFDKKYSELLSSRGRKGTDIRQVLRQVEVLCYFSKNFGVHKEIATNMFYVSTIFDIAAGSSIDDYLDHLKWRTAFKSISRVLSLLNINTALYLDLVAAADIAELSANNASDLMKKSMTDGGEAEEEKAPVNPNAVHVVGNLETFLIRLEDEYTKSLQQINPHTTEYVNRLSDEVNLVELIESVKAYYERVNDLKAAAVMALMQVEHMYYKHDSTARTIMRSHVFTKQHGRFADIHPASRTKAAIPPNSRDTSKVHPAAFSGELKVQPVSYDPAMKMQELCSFIYKHGDERSRARALLCAVYHHAVHDRYYQGRDLFLISHIQQTIDKADVKTQILYNRTLVTLGLAAFRQGLIFKAYDCLAGVCGNRMKELLAQGQSRWPDKDPEQEKIERRRQIPFHMHINQDLLDCVHLICAMFLELPRIARPHVPSGVISKPFRKYLNSYTNQMFTGPPENTREHVLAASKALLTGDWERASKFLCSLDVWNLIPNDGGSAVKVMLQNKVREESLRLYLITYGGQYEAVSLLQLCNMFQMEEKLVRKLVSKMIFQKDISGAWDQCGDQCSLVLYRVEASPLQNLVLQLTDKVSVLVESNERILDPLAGTYGYKDDWVRGDRKHPGKGAAPADDADKPRSNKSNWVPGVRGASKHIPKAPRNNKSDRRQTSTSASPSVWGGAQQFSASDADKQGSKRPGMGGGSSGGRGYGARQSSSSSGPGADAKRPTANWMTSN
jgi:translation initiation factor 3 subunit C